MDRINKVIKFEDLPEDALKALEKQYPDGWKAYIRKITRSNGDFFHAISVDTKKVSYLVKIDVKIDIESQMEKMINDFIDLSAEKEAEQDAMNENITDDETDKKDIS